MNILHHKSWHVRNKDNIARVRRDEAKAKAEQDEKERKVALAEQEVKLNYLRNKAQCSDQRQKTVPEDDSTSQEIRTEDDGSKLKHINFFQDLEDGAEVSVGGNAKYIKDKKEEQEKYEKQIGYLTYLGQDTNEALGKRDWYDLAPKKIDAYDDRGKKLEVGLKVKDYHDPLNVMKKYIKATEKLQNAKAISATNTHNKTLFPILTHVQKHHKHKSKKSSKSKKHKKEKSKKRSRSPIESRKSDEKVQKLLRLRAERLRREEIEKNRTKLLLSKYEVKMQADEPVIADAREVSLAPTIIEPVRVKQKYNSQFNPEIAKQNYEDLRRY
ncbi:hypothetical protein HA402_002230 [Bradysia odoriphaga]|nr:hypothetical protein HA402_002230 [Bradysia odoriphaga]